jgi:hypothetical protein
MTRNDSTPGAPPPQGHRGPLTAKQARSTACILADGSADSEDPRCLLAVSAERNTQLWLRLEAWRDGFRAGVAGADEVRLTAFADGWEAGLRAGGQRSAA